MEEVAAATAVFIAAAVDGVTEAEAVGSDFGNRLVLVEEAPRKQFIKI